MVFIYLPLYWLLGGSWGYLSKIAKDMGTAE